MASKWSAAYLAAMHKKPAQSAADEIDPSQHYSVKHRAEFLAALHAAKADGSIETWSISQVLGIIPPPVK
jgi:hypothetical protein